MTRRAFLALPAVTVFNVTKAEAASLHVGGRLIDGASDLSHGYFALCGETTGACHAKDAIGITVHPDNTIYMQALTALIGKDVQLSIF